VSGTVVSIEKEGYRPSKPIKVIPKVVEPVEHPKFKRAGPKGKCRKCGGVMRVMYKNPAPKGKTHVTYWCEECKKPRVGLI